MGDKAKPFVVLFQGCVKAQIDSSEQYSSWHVPAARRSMTLRHLETWLPDQRNDKPGQRQKFLQSMAELLHQVFAPTLDARMYCKRRVPDQRIEKPDPWQPVLQTV